MPSDKKSSNLYDIYAIYDLNMFAQSKKLK